MQESILAAADLAYNGLFKSSSGMQPMHESKMSCIISEAVYRSKYILNREVI